jgi:selenocysteine-specific elongation factor
VERLQIFKSGTLADRIQRLAAEAGAATLDETAVVARLGIAHDIARRELLSLGRAGSVRVLGETPATVADADVFKRAASRTAETVRRFHAAEPLLPGIGREDLKGQVFADASPTFFRAVLDYLVATKSIAIDQDVVHAHGRSVTLHGTDEQTRERLLAKFRELGLQAASPDDVAASVGVDRPTGRKIIQLLLKEQLLAKVNETLIVDRAALQKLVDDVRARKAVSPKLGVGEFKELTGLSRKYAVPLLEYLDGQRITRRVGDERVIL